uniref:Uncharacterized protein n=1 Tax=Palpitomonas bilix TaxID=652834 RepID=A0A7S3DAF3_9EUKA
MDGSREKGSSSTSGSGTGHRTRNDGGSEEAERGNGRSHLLSSNPHLSESHLPSCRRSRHSLPNAEWIIGLMQTVLKEEKHAPPLLVCSLVDSIRSVLMYEQSCWNTDMANLLKKVSENGEEKDPFLLSVVRHCSRPLLHSSPSSSLKITSSLMSLVAFAVVCYSDAIREEMEESGEGRRRRGEVGEEGENGGEGDAKRRGGKGSREEEDSDGESRICPHLVYCLLLRRVEEGAIAMRQSDHHLLACFSSVARDEVKHNVVQMLHSCALLFELGSISHLREPLLTSLLQKSRLSNEGDHTSVLVRGYDEEEACSNATTLARMCMMGSWSPSYRSEGRTSHHACVLDALSWWGEYCAAAQEGEQQQKLKHAASSLFAPLLSYLPVDSLLSERGEKGFERGVTMFGFLAETCKRSLDGTLAQHQAGGEDAADVFPARALASLWSRSKEARHTARQAGIVTSLVEVLKSATSRILLERKQDVLKGGGRHEAMSPSASHLLHIISLLIPLLKDEEKSKEEATKCGVMKVVGKLLTKANSHAHPTEFLAVAQLACNLSGSDHSTAELVKAMSNTLKDVLSLVHSPRWRRTVTSLLHSLSATNVGRQAVARTYYLTQLGDLLQRYEREKNWAAAKPLLDVLCHMSFFDDGRQKLHKDSSVMTAVTLYLSQNEKALLLPALTLFRNLCFDRAAKAHSLLRGDVVDTALACLSSSDHHIVLASAQLLWALLYNKQESRAYLRKKEAEEIIANARRAITSMPTSKWTDVTRSIDASLSTVLILLAK